MSSPQELREIFQKRKKLFIGIILFLIFILSFSLRLRTVNEPFLLRHDPFTWYHQGKFLLSGEKVEYDYLRLHPTPPKYKPNFFLYLSVYSYKFIHLFFPHLSFFRFCFWFPALLAALSVFPIYLIGRYLFGSLAGIFSAFFFNFTPFFLVRNMAGFFDTDPLNILFISSIVFLFLLSLLKIEEENSIKLKPILFAFLAGFLNSLFAWTWSGYWLPIWIISGSLILFFLIKINKANENNVSFKPYFLSFLVFILTFLIIAIPLRGITIIKNSIQGPFNFFTLKSPHQGELFPSVTPTITELQRPKNLFQAFVIDLGPGNFFLGIIGIFLLGYYLFIRNKKEKEVPFSLLLVWGLGTLISFLTSIRYGEYFALPLSLSAGFCLEETWKFFLRKRNSGIIFFLLIFTFFSLYASYSISSARSSKIRTKIDKNWADALFYLKEKTPKNSVVLAWWPYGYWVEGISERSTIIDGGCQDYVREIPLWEISKEECEKRKGYIPKSFDEFNIGSHICITSRIQDFSNILLTSDEKWAREILKTYQKDSEQIYLLLSPDLIPKSVYWSYFATWDREKKEGQRYRYKIEKTESKKYTIYIPKELENSLFTKLYLLDKKVRFFKLVYKNPEIKIYKLTNE